MYRRLDLFQGVTKSIPVVARDPATGSRLNLTGLSGSNISWKMARTDVDAAKLTYTIGSGITVTSATQGEFTITISAADLSRSVAGWFVHECKLLLSGVTYLPLRGKAVVAQTIQ